MKISIRDNQDIQITYRERYVMAQLIEVPQDMVDSINNDLWDYIHELKASGKSKDEMTKDGTSKTIANGLKIESVDGEVREFGVVALFSSSSLLQFQSLAQWQNSEDITFAYDGKPFTSHYGNLLRINLGFIWNYVLSKSESYMRDTTANIIKHELTHGRQYYRQETEQEQKKRREKYKRLDQRNPLVRFWEGVVDVFTNKDFKEYQSNPIEIQAKANELISILQRDIDKSNDKKFTWNTILKHLKNTRQNNINDIFSNLSEDGKKLMYKILYKFCEKSGWLKSGNDTSEDMYRHPEDKPEWKDKDWWREQAKNLRKADI